MTAIRNIDPRTQKDIASLDVDKHRVPSARFIVRNLGGFSSTVEEILLVFIFVFRVV